MVSNAFERSMYTALANKPLSIISLILSENNVDANFVDRLLNKTFGEQLFQDF